jgi:predicted ATPase/class 3 adenylate cyclase
MPETQFTRVDVHASPGTESAVHPAAVILTPDQRVRVFISSTLQELAEERVAARRAIQRLHLVPVWYESGARPHPPRSMYRAYLEQSQVFVGIYWQRYGWVAPRMDISGLEDEYRLAAGKPMLLYLKRPAPDQEPRLREFLDGVREAGTVSYRTFATARELERLLSEDLAVLLSESFAGASTGTGAPEASPGQPGPPGEAGLPAGTVTFLLTDIQGSTRLWESVPDAMAVALEQHNRLLTEVIQGHDGVVVTSRGEGDSFFAVFASAVQALSAAAACQDRLSSEPWHEGCVIKVRMALHTGEADLRDGEYHGHMAINRCARLKAAAHGGQVLVTQATYELGASHVADSLGFMYLGEHRLRDLAAPVRIYQLTGPGLATEFPPILTLAERTSNLPIEATTFVGRAGELTQIADLMKRNRLVTLIGPGGSGKTRLAVQVAADIAARFPDGQWLVELAALADQRLVAPQIAAVLRQPEFDVGQLSGKTLLILLDNCEHVIGTCAELVASLLRTCPGIAVLATSREPLNVDGEQTVRIGPLEPADAAELFTERAALARPDLDLSASDITTIAAICDRLDGIPLAIELAAARMRGMTPAEILEHLRDRFRLLTTRSTTTSERHQTLRAAVTWSYELLEEPEKAIYRRLCVFSGGWRMASAEAVCGGGFGDDGDVPDLVLTLVDKSLVLVNGQNTSRYWMLQTLREFGREKLEEAGELAELERRHGEHFLALGTSADWPTETWWLDPRVHDVALDLDNFRAALRWSKGQPPETELGLVVGAAPLWMAAGGFAEGQLALTEALQRAPQPSELRVKALERLAWLAVQHGDLNAAGRAAEEELHLAEELGGQFTASAQALLGFTALQQGNHDTASRLLDESLHIYQANGQLTGVAQVRHHQAALAMKTGNPACAEALFDDVVAIASQTQDTGLATYALLSSIPILVDDGRITDARHRWMTAYQHTGSAGSAVVNLALLGYAAAIAAADGRARRAVVLTEIALGLLSATGWQDDELLAWFWRTVAPAYEELDEAALAGAREQAQRMLPGAALSYAAGDDD